MAEVARNPTACKSPPARRGRRKATSISVHSEKQISAMLTRFGLEGTLLTYRDVRGALNVKYGTNLSVGTVYRLAHGHKPRSLALRRALGIVAPRKPRVEWRKRAAAAEALLLETSEVLEDVWLQFAVPGKGGVLWAGGLSTLEEVEDLRPKIAAALALMRRDDVE